MKLIGSYLFPLLSAVMAEGGSPRILSLGLPREKTRNIKFSETKKFYELRVLEIPAQEN